MTEIEELLGRLKELDPKKTEEEYSKRDRQLPLTNIDPKIRDAVLQLVIQNAIAANDNFIGFEIIYTSYFDVKYEAEIFWDRTGEILRGFGETAVEAILAAYVMALEAEHGDR